MSLTSLAAIALTLGVSAFTTAGIGCSIGISTGGTLKLSAAGTRLASDESGGAAATLTIANLTTSAVTITVASPVLTSFPSGFNSGLATTRVKYAGGGLLSGVTRAYTPAQTSFSVPALLSIATILTLNNEVTTTAGFAAGTYQTRTTLTCS